MLFGLIVYIINLKFCTQLQVLDKPYLWLLAIGLSIFPTIISLEVNNIEEIRIIHGKGTGALRSAVTDYLKTHPNVSEYRLGRYGEGENGVTIAKLK